ncbi:protein FAR1-RELATED SEQUENCE 5-like [Juglans microcarpa x Juglans regia]|uniref:protein FAR1-RELATED SEQUENCE 5-like n=1 Tax=Juglans microcarpa x Juglans regia TaxID=2249226 RepID=UPI001B7DF891|nr:protein FAR1-RELATED SEQUENCE 5-like [Juglans microcarpa x Juglans regia]
MDVDDETRLRNVFWADAYSRAAYESFGDVITFDTTYLTNAYKMPFAPFVGVNNHGQSILFGCGLISGEDTDTFIWLFESWLKCMNGHAPQAIITDQDKAMQNAIAKVFSKSRNRFCLWHIMKKVSEKFGAYSQYDDIKSQRHRCVYDMLSRDEFDKCWQQLLDSFDLHDHSWLEWLYSERHLWVPAYIKNDFWVGMSSTQRSEGMNAFFDDYINSKTTLKHVIRVLTLHDKEEVPAKYVLDRWRKDLKRDYTLVQSSRDDLSYSPNAHRMNKLNKACYDISSIAGTSDEGCAKVTNGSEKLKSHVAARSKGRPVSKRKQSSAEKAVNWLKARKTQRLSQKNRSRLDRTVVADVGSLSLLDHDFPRACTAQSTMVQPSFQLLDDINSYATPTPISIHSLALFCKEAVTLK